MKKYRSYPRLNSMIADFDFPPFIEAESQEGATAYVLRCLGYKSVDGFNCAQEDQDDYLSVEEVSPEYIAALETILADPVMDCISTDLLNVRETWEPTDATKAAIKQAVATSGTTETNAIRKACNRIMMDMREYGVPAADWSWMPMMRLYGETVTKTEFRSRK